MLNTYNNTPQTVATNGNIVFNQNDVRRGCSVTHAAGSSTIQLNLPGVYEVTFDATFAASAASTTPVIVQLVKNGAAVPGGTSAALSTGTSDIRNVSFTKLIPVLPSCASVNNETSITIQNTGVSATYSNVNLTAKRIPD